MGRYLIMRKRVLESQYFLAEGPILCKKVVYQHSLGDDWTIPVPKPSWYVINGCYHIDDIGSLKILWCGNYLPYGENEDYNKNIQYIESTLNKSSICKLKESLFELKYFLIRYLILDSNKIVKPFYSINYWLYGKVLRICNNYNDFVYPILKKIPSPKFSPEQQTVKENIALQIVQKYMK